MLALRRSMSAAATATKPSNITAQAAAKTSKEPAPTTKTHKSEPALSWNEYFSLRTSRNRARPLGGVPGFALGTGAVVRFAEFNPFEPIFGGVDPAFVYGFGAVGAGLLAYQVGAAVGQLGWRVKHAAVVRQMDTMDRSFYARIERYRAERGQSPYAPGQTANKLVSGLLKAQKGSADQPAAAAALRQDFYGERVKSVGDYRQWLRRQRALVKEQLGPDAPLIKVTKYH